MDSLIHNFVPYLEKAANVTMLVVVIASFIARLTPTPKDDKLVSKISSFIIKIVKFLPTVGVNPHTKSLENALESEVEDGDSKSN